MWAGIRNVHLYSAPSIIVTASVMVTPIPSNHSPPFTHILQSYSLSLHSVLVCRLWSLFLTTALIQLKIAYPLISQRTSIIRLIILIYVRCNTSSFSLFNDHISLPCNIQLYTCIMNFSSQQQSGSEERGQWPKLKLTTTNPGSYSSISIAHALFVTNVYCVNTIK